MKIHLVLGLLQLFLLFVLLTVNVYQKMYVHVMKDGQTLNAKIQFVMELSQQMQHTFVLLMELAMDQIPAIVVLLDTVEIIANTHFVVE